MVSSHNEFSKESLIEGNLQPNPHLQFSDWLNEYLQMGVTDSIAMSFSTINSEGFPSTRIVFMRHYNENGFVFYTNYDSNKGKEIRENNKASILFYWPELERQIRVWGIIEKIEDDVSDAYFKERSKESQAGAWISKQSKEIKNRVELEEMHQDFLRAADNKIIPRPKFWGGYRLKPIMYEFWQARDSRLHDRFLYKQVGGNWKIMRLAP
jgi:pyridoxamine 5'-phosphate oxidase